ncbi:GNAT family N-acetyltransferase [Rhizobium sp.]
MAISRSHDRGNFDCGQADLNRFLAQQARQSHDSGTSKTYVAADAANLATILGFYTMSPAQVELDRVPEAARPRGSRYPVTGFRLARLAVSKAVQGQGLGGQLLLAAAARSIRASLEVGGTVLLIDAKDDTAAAWYALYGAIPINDAPLSLVLTFDTLRATLAAAGHQI